MSTRDTKATLWFVRHGESTWNAAGLVQGQAEGSVLTAKGRREAAAGRRTTGRHPRRLPSTPAIWSGRARRQSIIGHALRLPLRYRRRALRERNFGDAEGQPARELEGRGVGHRGRAGRRRRRPATGRGVPPRVRTTVSGPSSTTWTPTHWTATSSWSTHGGVIRVAEAYDSGVGVDAMPWVPVPNASVWNIGRPCPADRPCVQ